MNIKMITTLLLALTFSLVQPLMATDAASVDDRFEECLTTTWPHEKSDLLPDPALHFGKLKNGFRYVMMANREPKSRVALYLNIQAGSLYENDEQRGLAHFLEHMLFNGTTHFPAGKLVEYFQSIGMNFGGDTNAHTTFDETVYNIILPGNSDEEIEKGLLVMSDYARGALLPENEINRERGVILSEKRARDSASYRTYVAETQFTMRGTQIPERMPIGVVETLKKADRKRLLDFYNSWYRPENMILVMVGDFDPNKVEPLITNRFTQLKNDTLQPECPKLGRPNQEGTQYFYHHEPEQGSAEISIESIWYEKPQDDSYDLQKENIYEYVVALLVQHRLEKMLETGNSPFTSGNYYAGNFLGSLGYGSIQVKTDGDKWKKSLKTVEKMLRQALEYGFKEQELNRVKKEIENRFESAVMKAETRSSMDLATQIITNLNRNRVFQSPLQEKELYLPVIKSMTRESVQRTFRKTWSHNNRLITLTGNAIIDKEPLAVIKAVYRESLTEKVEGLIDDKVVSFPYITPLSTPVEPLQCISFQKIDAKRLVFKNGVIVNLKKTPFQKNSISITADLGFGKQSEPVAGMGFLAESVINDSGSGKLKKSQLQAALAGSSAEIHFNSGETSFKWIGTSTSQDSEQLFQLLQTVLIDPGMRDDSYQLAMRNFQQMYSQLNREVNGSLQLYVDRFFGGGNDFFGLEPWGKFSEISLISIKKWLLPVFDHGSLEISIVGDFNEQQMVNFATKYFGSLPERGVEERTHEKVIFPSGQTMRMEVETQIEKALVVIGWPTDDFWDINRTRRLHMLASVFRDRLRKIIREKLGATYSPVVYNKSSRVFSGYGVMKVMMIVDPDKVDIIKNEVLALASELREGGVSEEELVRAKSPALTSIKDMIRTNQYWLNSVLSLSSRYPMQLQWPTTILSEFSSITREELSEMARKYFDNDKSGVAIVTPKGKRHPND